jgi:hypothetical protein
VKTLSSYAPVEPELKVEALEAFQQKLVQLTKEVIRKGAEVTEARIQRNGLLFGKKWRSRNSAKCKTLCAFCLQPQQRGSDQSSKYSVQ